MPEREVRKVPFGSLLRLFSWHIVNSVFERFEYSNYAPWGSKIFPRAFRAYQNHDLVIEASVDELANEARREQEVLVPLPGSTMHVTCDHPDPPRRLKGKEPGYTSKARAQRVTGSVYTFVVIGRDGKVQHAEMISSLDPDLDESTLTTIENWQFKPAMCGPEPVQTGVVVETKFRLF